MWLLLFAVCHIPGRPAVMRLIVKLEPMAIVIESSQHAYKNSNISLLQGLIEAAPSRIMSETVERNVAWIDCYRNALSAIMLRIHAGESDGDIARDKAQAAIAKVVEVSKDCLKLKEEYKAQVPHDVQGKLFGELEKILNIARGKTV
ncbi:MAG: hypothetical protein V4526_02850 [Patescibacteria group bacterium]